MDLFRYLLLYFITAGLVSSQTITYTPGPMVTPKGFSSTCLEQIMGCTKYAMESPGGVTFGVEKAKACEKFLSSSGDQSLRWNVLLGNARQRAFEFITGMSKRCEGDFLSSPTLEQEGAITNLIMSGYFRYCTVKDKSEYENIICEGYEPAPSPKPDATETAPPSSTTTSSSESSTQSIKTEPTESASTNPTATSANKNSTNSNPASDLEKLSSSTHSGPIEENQATTTTKSTDKTQNLTIGLAVTGSILMLVVGTIITAVLILRRRRRRSRLSLTPEEPVGEVFEKDAAGAVTEMTEPEGQAGELAEVPDTSVGGDRAVEMHVEPPAAAEMP